MRCFFVSDAKVEREDGQERWIKDEKDPMRSDLFLLSLIHI